MTYDVAATGKAASAARARARTVPHVRIQGVDVLRGFALLGIVLINAQVMAGPHIGSGGRQVVSSVDGVVAWLVTALVSGKFYLLFSFLFGYSFTLQRASAEREGAAFAPRHLRRMVCLFLIGVAHAVLLFRGDILMTYAALSLVLFAARDTAPRTAVGVASWLICGLGLFLLSRGLLTLATVTTVPTDPHHVRSAAAGIEETAVAYRGDPVSVVRANVRLLREALAGDVLYAPHMLAAFLAGLAAGRRGVLAAPGRYRAQMKRVVRWGLPIGLAGGVFMAVCCDGPLDARWSDVGLAAGVLTAPALTAAYVCGLLLLRTTRPGRRLGVVLAPAGRMALTNYLTQSLVLALVFTGYGLALYGRLGTATVLIGCCTLYGAQLACSRWLMRRARYGPVEWFLRTVTLARRP
ncbi:DUF418 domain-containing protein [Streptomyces sp. NPDC050523]|uniref:DUF418 domain-containing protein n=1 Tax=Streptomyces sp. NPDC050523 TaxID=3365622 RepID=UPI0037BCD331